MRHLGLLLAVLAAPLITLPARATEVASANATDNIYGAGQSAAPGGGTVPGAIIKVPRTAACFVVRAITGSLACHAKEGCITLNSSMHFRNDPDGAYAQVPVSENDGTKVISGIKAPGAGYLVGLFVAGRTPKGPAPAPLDFTTGSGTAFTSLSPLLDQTFFVGDGRTNKDNGPRQTFMIPTGATTLYFGVSDACGFQGAPGCYFDNAGTYQFAVAFRRSCGPP